MKKISKNVYVETDFQGCNTGFVVTDDGVVMIDTPLLPTDALVWRERIAQHGTVRYLINTEPHIDHFAGNYFFRGTVIAQEGVREAIIATDAKRIKEWFKEDSPADYALVKRFKFRPPTVIFSKELTLFLGKHTFHLINLPGHTPYQTAVYIPEEKVIFTSDNVFYKVLPWLQEAVPYEWLESLKKLETWPAKVLVPGHGDVCKPNYLSEMRTGIQLWIDTVTDCIKRGMSLEQAQEKINLLDRYLIEPWDKEIAVNVQKMNVTHLYEILKAISKER